MKHDRQVQEYILSICLAGSIVNTSVAIAAAKGLLLAKNRCLLPEYGGNLELKKSWARSLLIRMGFVKCKGTTSGKITVDELDAIKSDFIGRILSVVKSYNSPPQLVINVDETGIHLVPISNWTMERQGSN